MTAAGLREPPAAKALLIAGGSRSTSPLMLLLPLGAVLFEALRQRLECVAGAR